MKEIDNGIRGIMSPEVVKSHNRENLDDKRYRGGGGLDAYAKSPEPKVRAFGELQKSGSSSGLTRKLAFKTTTNTH